MSDVRATCASRVSPAVLLPAPVSPVAHSARKPRYDRRVQDDAGCGEGHCAVGTFISLCHSAQDDLGHKCCQPR